MLNAFQRKIDALILDPDDEFERKIQRRLGGRAKKGLCEELKEFIRLLPRIERRIYSLYVWLPADSRVKDVGSYFLTYMYKPQDFIPENDRNGLLGYLDDAYLASLFYEVMLEEIAGSNQLRIRRADADLLKRVIGLRRKAAAVIPDEAIKIKQMLGELFAGEETTFNSLFAKKTDLKKEAPHVERI